MNATVPASVSKALAVAAVAVMALTGCSFAASITTHKPYDPSDGIGLVIDDVSIQNLLLVAEGQGEEGVFLGSVTNPTGENETVTLTVQGSDAEGASIVVNAGSTTRLGTDEGQELVTGVAPVLPGLLATVDVAVGAEVVTVQVPVVDGTLPEYAAVLEAK